MTAERTRIILTAALDVLIDKPTAHTTGALARDMNSAPVPADSPYAVCWCTNGLFLHICRSGSLDAPDVFPCTQLVLLAACELGYRSVSACNDLMGRPGAFRMLSRAIELLDTEDFGALLERAKTATPADRTMAAAAAGQEGER